MTAAAPALYEAVVTHTRRTPLVNRFRYGTYYWLVDVSDPPRLRWPLHSLARFDRLDHVDVPARLAEWGLEADRVLMLAHARVLGYVFNPISVFWCYDTEGELVATVAEVHNTYGGRHAYRLDAHGDGVTMVDKALPVSPFNPAEGQYRLQVSEPGERVRLTVALWRDGGGPPFVATLSGRRRALSLHTLLRLNLRYPWAPLRTAALIRWQGVRLWLRGLAVHPR